MVRDPSSGWTGSEAASALLCICEFDLFIVSLSEVVFIPFVSSGRSHWLDTMQWWIPESAFLFSTRQLWRNCSPSSVCHLDSDGAEQCRYLCCFLESLSESTFQWNYPQREPAFLALLLVVLRAVTVPLAALETWSCRITAACEMPYRTLQDTEYLPL